MLSRLAREQHNLLSQWQNKFLSSEMMLSVYETDNWSLRISDTNKLESTRRCGVFFLWMFLGFQFMNNF